MRLFQSLFRPLFWSFCFFICFSLFPASSLATSSNETENEIEESSLHAKAALLMDADSGRVLYEKNGYTRLPMASTTKIMTCIYVLETANLEDTVTISSLAASQPKVRLGVQAGEEYRLGDLLYALMLESYNDVAVAIAEHVGGTVEDFCKAMTKKARDLGCKDTCFQTPNGLDADNHYTTARDLALIARYAIKNENFLKITNTPSYEIREQKKQTPHSLTNKDAFLHQFDGAIGVKTGFTGKAGYCFVGAVKREEKSFISVVLASGWPPNKQWKWSDTKLLMNYAVSNYEYREVLSTKKRSSLPVMRGLADQVCIAPEKSLSLLLSKKDKVTIKTKYPDKLTAPIKSGQLAGFAYIYVNNELIKTIPLRSTYGVQKMTYFDYLGKIVHQFIDSDYINYPSDILSKM